MWDVHSVLLAQGGSSSHASTAEAAEISRVRHPSAAVCALGTRSPVAMRAIVRWLVVHEEALLSEAGLIFPGTATAKAPWSVTASALQADVV